MGQTVPSAGNQTRGGGRDGDLHVPISSTSTSKSTRLPAAMALLLFGRPESGDGTEVVVGRLAPEWAVMQSGEDAPAGSGKNKISCYRPTRYVDTHLCNEY